jgi:hypothetical protein
MSSMLFNEADCYSQMIDLLVSEFVVLLIMTVGKPNNWFLRISNSSVFLTKAIFYNDSGRSPNKRDVVYLPSVE